MLTCFCLSLVKRLPCVHQVLHFRQFSLGAPLQCFKLAESLLDVFVKGEEVSVSSLKTGEVTRSHVAQILGRIASFDVVGEQPAQYSCA